MKKLNFFTSNILVLNFGNMVLYFCLVSVIVTRINCFPLLYVSSIAFFPLRQHTILNVCACKSVTVTTASPTYISHVFSSPWFSIFIMIRFTHSWYCVSQTRVQRICVEPVRFFVCMLLTNLWWPIHRFVRPSSVHLIERKAICCYWFLLHTHVRRFEDGTIYINIYIDNSVYIRTKFPTYFRLRFQIHLGEYCDCFWINSINRSTVWCWKAISYIMLFSYINVPCLSVQRISAFVSSWWRHLMKIALYVFLCFGLSVCDN